jgi:hypothetical protein
MWDASARLVEDPEEDSLARRLLLEKYEPGYSGDLTDWGRRAVPVAIDVSEKWGPSLADRSRSRGLVRNHEVPKRGPNGRARR